MIPVVIDTNVLVSALFRSNGNEASVLAAVRDERIRPYMSDAIRSEYVRVLNYPRLRFVQAEINGVLTLFNALGILVVPGRSAYTSPDPDDTAFIACAVAAGAQFLVTGNRRHFPEPFYGTAEVVNARQLLDRLAARA